MISKNHVLIAIFLALLCYPSLYSQELPLLGAQVFIEPGQTAEETELWFKTMRDHGMQICRIRMFESYMRQSDGSWDFSLFDQAFKLAEKYNIKVMGTFFPTTTKTDIGGWKFPKDREQLGQFAEYIKQLVTHFKKYKSLYAWVLINEPGGGLRDTAFSREIRQQWNQEHPQREVLDNGYPVLVDLQDERFKEYMTSWMLNWIAEQVRVYDEEIHLHVNNHAIFSNLPEYDFPYWRTFLNSLGGSAHPSWHYTAFPRDQYALILSANSEILLSGAGHLPWLMTEIQGGNNTYSSNTPMCPTAEEITQWLWMILGTEGKGGIFWTLNPRASGVESGEWALLDFQHQPTDRVAAIKRVSDCIQQNNDVFKQLKKIDSGINLLYIRESLWAENVITQGTPAATDSRKIGLKNLLGYFKALSEMGINANIKAFEEFDFTKENYTGSTIILANQIVLPVNTVKPLEHFVKKGGTLLVDGLTGYYDEHVHNRMLTDFPFAHLFGGQLAEFRHSSDIFYYELAGMQVPASLWKGFLKPDEKSTALATFGEHITATRSNFGEGSVIWIPGLLGLPAWEDAQPLAKFLTYTLPLDSVPLRFEQHAKNVVMKTLQPDEAVITILVNKAKTEKEVELNGCVELLNGRVLFSTIDRTSINGTIKLYPEETLVVQWR
ncbi:beta-galactosidase trimerization domain-containing protein [candidate division KSB1 bacterium]|nr:beta-galactosidase trimerization domain-containing protein [candidate division KSB1 bacterium]